MQWYKRHIGDWAKDTGHLSLLESGAYDKLIAAYYRTESPLPLDIKLICHMIGARTPQDRIAIKNVIKEFFIEQSDGYHQKRCDMEISKYAAQRATNQFIGKRGGRPKTKTESVIFTKPINTPNQEPRYKDLVVMPPTRTADKLQNLMMKALGQEPEPENPETQKPDKNPDIERNREIARQVMSGERAVSTSIIESKTLTSKD